MDPITTAVVGWVISQAGTAGLHGVKRLVLGDKQQNALRATVREAIASAVDETLAADDRKIVREALLRESPDTADVRVTDALDLRSAILAQLRPRLNVLAEQGYDVDPGRLTDDITLRISTSVQGDAIRGGPLKPLAEFLRHEAVVERLDELKQGRGATPVALAQLPPRVAGFTGRSTELTLMTGLLDPAGQVGVVVVSAVAGPAGVGKTALAVQAGHHARERGWFEGGILFIDLHGYDESPVEPGQALDALLRALGIAAEHIPPDAETRAALYRSALAQMSEPVLLIADDASSEAQVRPLLPGSGPHRVVVTSRRSLGGLDARLLDVVVLDNAAGVTLLDAALRAGRPDDERIAGNPDDAARLAQVCGGLPLALQIVAAMLKADPDRAVDELADDLAGERLRLERLRFDDGSGASAGSVVAAFELSYRRLDETSARVFRMLSLNPGPDLSPDVAAILADLPVHQTREKLRGLARTHLIESAPGGGGRWRMHDLVRLYALRLSESHADADGREHARDRLLDYYLRTASAADQHVRALPGMVLPEVFSDRDAALAWFDAERSNLVAAVRMAADTGRDQVALYLPNVLEVYLGWRWRLDDLLATITTSAETARRLGDRHAEGIALNQLGSALRQLRRFDEAITALRNAAAILHETGDRHSEGQAQFNLGVALRGTRRFDEAVTAFLKDLEICGETDDRHGMAITLNSLGIVLRETERFAEAITAHQEAAAIYQETSDQHGNGLALNNLGSALSKARRFDEAIIAHQEATVILRKTDDRHNLAMTLTSLGATLAEVQRFAEALTAHQEAAALFREIGDRHGEGLAVSNVGAALLEMRRFDEALTAERDAAAIFRETGDQHSLGGTLHNLGRTLEEMQRFDEAITVYQDAAAIYQETGDYHSLAGALNNIGITLQAARRFDEAVAAHQVAVSIYYETGDRQSANWARHNLKKAQAAQQT